LASLEKRKIEAVAKVDIPNKYREPRKTDTPMTDAQRKEYRQAHPNAKPEDLFVTLVTPVLFCKKGDTLLVITEDIGDHRNVIICANKQDERVSVKMSEVDIITPHE